ncbi:MAG: amidohydrolase family protein [Pseudomonadota bacterium]
MQVIRGGLLLDAPAHKAEARDLLLNGDTIEEIGRPGLAAPEGTEVIDATGRLLIPGLVNAHTHSHGALSKGLGDRWTLELLLNAGPWITGGQTPEDRYTGTLLNAAEMIRRGCTATYDLTWEFPAPSAAGIEGVAKAYDDIGLRALVAPMLADTNLYQSVPGLMGALPEDLQKKVAGFRFGDFKPMVDACKTLLKDWPHDRERIDLALAPTIPLFCSEEFLIACRNLAEEHGARIHTHLAESKIQALTGLERYGMTLTAYFDQLGLITERFTGAHGVWLDSDDRKRLADRGASIALNPGSNLRLGSGIPDARALLDAGVTVAVASDGSSSSDNQNMFEAARLTAYTSRVLSHDPERWLSNSETFQLATEGGAKAMGMERSIGKIAPGFKADIVFLDLDDLAYVPLNDPVNQIIQADDGSSVESVMIGGAFVYRNRQFTTIDLAKLIADARAARARLNELGAERKALAGRLAPLVTKHCACFAARRYHIARMGFGPGKTAE